MRRRPSELAVAWLKPNCGLRIQMRCASCRPSLSSRLYLRKRLAGVCSALPSRRTAKPRCVKRHHGLRSGITSRGSRPCLWKQRTCSRASDVFWPICAARSSGGLERGRAGGARAWRDLRGQGRLRLLREAADRVDDDARRELLQPEGGGRLRRDQGQAGARSGRWGRVEVGPRARACGRKNEETVSHGLLHSTSAFISSSRVSSSHLVVEGGARSRRHQPRRAPEAGLLRRRCGLCRGGPSRWSHKDVDGTVSPERPAALHQVHTHAELLEHRLDGSAHVAAAAHLELPPALVRVLSVERGRRGAVGKLGVG